MSQRTYLTKTLGAVLGAATLVSAMPMQFIYGGHNYGVMDITVRTANSLQISFTATQVPGVSDFQVTGFGFTFNELYRMGNLAVSNPADNALTTDQNSLDWLRLTNLNALPQPANTNLVRKDDYKFGVTEGKANNINPPGIRPGQTDIYYLSGFKNLSAATDLTDVVTLTGIRIQAILPGGSSLFLAGTDIVPPTSPHAVPEPSTVALLGAGLLGLALARRRKKA